mgnify:CR=1 FL=1
MKGQSFTHTDRVALLARADAILAAPPASPYTERHPGRGVLVVRFVLPLELAQPLNRTRHAAVWMMDRERSRILATMRAQWMRAHFAGSPIPPSPIPLPGRPMLRAIRFSSVESDPTSAWWKVCGDVMLPTRTRRGRAVPGLGLIEDDRPSKLETRAWHERAARGEGFAMVELWTGDAP